MENRSIRELPDVPWMIYEASRFHSPLRMYASYVFAGLVNLFLLALYISAVIWIVRGLT